jgi:N-acetylneuraminate synthase
MVARLRGRVADLTLLQCTTAYPCPPEKVGLNLLGEFRARYGVKVGLSDHSGSIYAGLAAVALGAEALEVHVTFSRECFGPDVPASLTTRELAQLVEGARAIEKMLAHPVDKDALAGEAAPARAIFQKSVVARVPLAAGSVLREADLALKKPGAGLGPERIPELVGRRLTRALAADEAISEADLVAPAEVGV